MAPNATGTAPLLRDVIDIKTSISTSDFVLKLAEAVTEEGAARALRDYVVTERLLENFDEALSLIKASLDGHTSKAAYLHGSFGSGKSHFMAVLHALLRGDAAVRSRGDFDPVLTKHEWLGADGKRFLLVPYHMLGAKSLEQRVLGGYVSHVKSLPQHKDAPTPQVYRTDSLFEDIRSHRHRVGDETFIAGLADAPTPGATADDEDDDEWGDPFTWTPELLNTALSAEELDGGEVNLNLVNPSTPAELRAKLVHDASVTWFPGFARHAAEDEHGFISLDAGLAVIAEHAKSLGYDGLILFLDELILWLANRIHDQKFVSRETDKITNFVEGADSRRAIPIVSFIARQRDLRELVGEETSGAAETAIQDSLNLASGRFDKITLEDRNLPQIAHARLLTPKDAEAAAKLDAAFAKVKRVGPQVWDVLLGSDEATTGADEESFRLTYPFSPAFMDTLVHISSALQRSRTGLKLMGQLLADHRDDATLENLIPLGDLYPVIADGGDKPFVDSLKVEFKVADKLYRTKLRPHLLGTYEITEEDVERYQHRRETITDPQLLERCRGFVGDNRLMCTLLLSALAPGVPALRDLTIRRLGALNHGSVLSPIPGAEVGMIKAKVDEWATHFVEIKATGTKVNPGVRLELAGVDVDSVIANANVNNNRSNRRALARRLLAKELGLEVHERLGSADDLALVWRGSNRTAEVVIGDVNDPENLPDHEFSPSQEGLWRLVIDLPYQESEHGSVEAVNRLRTLREQSGAGTRTVGWIPTYLSAPRYKDFQKLVVIDYALADQRRFDTHYAQHLNTDNRARARVLLEEQRESLIKTVTAAFKQAYGCADKKASDVDVSFEDHFESLRDVPDLKVSIGQSLSEGARHIAKKLLAHQFPAHPDLDPDGTHTAVTPAQARTVFGHIRAAAESAERQVEVPSKDRPLMRRIAAPLGLGQQGEVYFRPSSRWVDHFNLQARTDGGPGDLSVVKLAEWIDRPDPMGLDGFLVNLVIASYAEMDDRVWVRAGSLLDPAPELSAIKPQDGLRSQPLPDEAVWEEAGRRFWDIFGEQPPKLRRGRLVSHFARQITARARDYKPHVDTLVEELEKHAKLLGLDGADEPGTGRLTLARRSRDLLKELRDLSESTAGGSAAAKQVITTFAAFELGEASAGRYGATIKQAKAVADALVVAAWDMLKLAPSYGPQGEAVLEALRGAARADQRTMRLEDALRDARKSIVSVIERSQAAARPQPPTANPTDPPVPVSPPARPTTPDAVSLSDDTARPPVSTNHPLPGPRAGRRSGGGRAKASQVIAQLRAELDELTATDPDATIEISWRVVE
ncbi:phage resistance protein [Streptomyces sp. 4503]|uniref:Phage resistance protein n=1 Tax=Streptomyces niphimycinicus TaxID=2842201 RepID=A0ABS6C7N2_9ACTN|nr:phage resistance protein [Streptomyces niphimycinicus]MBU3862888.1 phage resistance protein [Streptomyces niphimycinicus]